MKKLYQKIIMTVCIICIGLVSSQNNACAYMQTKTTKTLDINRKCTLTAYAAFDTFGHKMSNGKEWNYKASVWVTNSPKKGTLKLVVTGQATVKTSASVSLGLSESGVSAGSSSSWTTVSDTCSQSVSISKQSSKQETSVTSNLVVTPKKYYKTNTACIVVQARVKFSGSKRVYFISACA